jgi:hypothetical protein
MTDAEKIANLTKLYTDLRAEHRPWVCTSNREAIREKLEAEYDIWTADAVRKAKGEE